VLTALAGVLGFPVGHSRSPAMMNAAFAELGLDWRYFRLPVAPDRFDEIVRALPGSGYLGANVTIPHKVAAHDLADELTEAAAAIGAVNTLTFLDGRILGDNTDAGGLVDALDLDLRGVTVLVLGAGGTGRAAVWALREAGAEVAVWNRTPERARALAADLGVQAVAAPVPADVLVNCTSVGLTDPSSTFKNLPVSADSVGEYACVVDLVYRAGDTVLAQEARRRGSQVIDGLEILVRQGALSFEGWTGRAAPLHVMRESAAR
jgi:shikimate dehydrogenase